MLRDSDRQQLSDTMAKIGITVPLPESVDWPVFEGDYIKFMGGEVYDKAAADQLETWLMERGFDYERHRERAIRGLDRRAVLIIAEAFGLAHDEIIENFHQTTRRDDAAWYVSQLAKRPLLPVWTTPVVRPRPYIPNN